MIREVVIAGLTVSQKAPIYGELTISQNRLSSEKFVIIRNCSIEKSGHLIFSWMLCEYWSLSDY